MSSSSLSLSPGTIAISLRSQFPSASFVDCADICVTSLQSDSRRCQPGDLFVVIAGTRESAEKYIPEAIKNGAKAVLTGRPLTGLEVPQCIVADVRKAYAILCMELADRPSRQLEAVGITGTNGKTTVSWLVRSILQSAGHKTGLSGTVEYHDGNKSRPSSLTTPDALELSQLLSAMVKNEVTHAVMEVSSHALDQSRLAGTLLAVAAVTNVTQDHFDYHQNLKNYAACKARIIQHLKPEGTLVLNFDDPVCRSMADGKQSAQKLLTYGLESEADLQATEIQESAAGTEFEIVFGSDTVSVSTTLIGRHNVSNCLAATAVCLGLGLSLQEIVTGIQALENVPGRMEQVNCGQSCTVLIDYAHTDDALRHAILSARQVCNRRLFCVFGAGGDRDSSKRGLLGIAGSEADRVVITSDNPRSEDPFQIMKAIAAGCQSQGVTPELIEDRKAAIEYALSEAGAGDLVLIAGKGHECEQILRDRKVPFRDRLVVEQYFAEQKIPDSQKVSA
ncbi:UDP-N-acetylmuramoyl-L-alanyl-D-glutamate--2,6-diaminopimelate ligase [Gimesia chilikensis]|uniref:UDP-N-acetylmuramoyl-L-alanyl-D-glutamate--2, 6-diaminopimelate ligase n=1 Tax=Gimesia chilikensis TaxID=2605989 RepID=UPI003A924A12